MGRPGGLWVAQEGCGERRKSQEDRGIPEAQSAEDMPRKPLYFSSRIMLCSGAAILWRLLPCGEHPRRAGQGRRPADSAESEIPKKNLRIATILNVVQHTTNVKNRLRRVGTFLLACLYEYFARKYIPRWRKTFRHPTGNTWKIFPIKKGRNTCIFS